MAPGTARSGARGGRTPSNQGRGRDRARGTAATRGRGRGGGRGGRGGSRGRERQRQRREASRDPRRTPDGGKPHGFVSVLLRDYSHENFTGESGPLCVTQGTIRSGIRRIAPPSLHLHIHRKPDLSLNFGCNHTLGDHSSNCGYNRGCKEPGYNRRSN